MNFPRAESADIGLLLEGTFPYVSGGVSSWVNQIIRGFPQGGFKFEVQQFMVFLCTAFPRRRIPHAGFYNPAPFWGDD